jgi:hypothetical protein
MPFKDKEKEQEYYKKYCQQNRERIRKRERNYYQQNKVNLIEKRRNKYLLNVGKHREQNRKYYQRNKEKVNKRGRDSYRLKVEKEGRKVRPVNINWRPIDKAAEYVQTLGIKSKDGWSEYIKTAKLPDDIPKSPNTVYKRLGQWKGWAYFFGNYDHLHWRSWRPFEQAREYVRSQNIKNNDEWWEYCKSDKKPNDIPSTPERVYKNKGWNGFSDFLGNMHIGSQPKLSYKQAKELLKPFKITSQAEFHKLRREGKLPPGIPHRPDYYYSKKCVIQ